MSDDDPSDREDPFDRLGPGGERDGDPFERLGDESPGEEGDQDVPADDDPWVPPGEVRRDQTSDDEWPGPASPETDGTNTNGVDPGPTATPDRSADPTPFDDPSDPFAKTDTPTESPFDGADSVFERVDSGGADPDQVWEAITGKDDEGDGDAEPSVPDEGRYSDVSKHTFCERCEHFSPPPDVSCGHHTAEIIEFLDMETVRLLDCPIVAEREGLERDE